MHVYISMHDTPLLNTQRYKEERSLLHLGVVAIEKGAFWSPSITVANFTFFYLHIGQTWLIRAFINEAGETAQMYMWHNNHNKIFLHSEMQKVNPFQKEILSGKRPNRTLETKNAAKW